MLFYETGFSHLGFSKCLHFVENLAFTLEMMMTSSYGVPVAIPIASFLATFKFAT